jgi:hypothetical protein
MCSVDHVITRIKNFCHTRLIGASVGQVSVIGEISPIVLPQMANRFNRLAKGRGHQAKVGARPQGAAATQWFLSVFPTRLVLVELGVLLPGLPVNRDVRIGIFPKSKKLLVGVLGRHSITHHPFSSGQLQM